jgi:uncharacterized damage-inducible protein DinB
MGTITRQIAKNFREVYFGGNWTASSLKEQLADVTWEEATKQVYGFNTIATLTFHIHYYVPAIAKVLQGGELIAKDELSFDHAPIRSQQDWDGMLSRCWKEAEVFASLIQELPDDKLTEDFADPKYGNYHRNLLGIVEHTHYHTGQISLIKKLVKARD